MDVDSTPRGASGAGSDGGEGRGGAGGAGAGQGQPPKVVEQPQMDCPLPVFNLVDTPSRKDGISEELEKDLRIIGCTLIQNTGIIMGQHQMVMACAQILFQRFFYRKSFLNWHVEIAAMACLFLASKIEESPKRLRDVIACVHHVMHRLSRKGEAPEPLDVYTLHFKEMKADVIDCERFILKELGFCVHVKHPHKLIISYQIVMGLNDRKDLSQLAWSYMNDGLRTDVFIRFPVEAIACACLHLGFLKLGIPMPDFWECFGVTESTVLEISVTILALYERPVPFLEDLAQMLANLRSQAAAPPAAAADTQGANSREPRSRSPARGGDRGRERGKEPSRDRDRDRNRDRGDRERGEREGERGRDRERERDRRDDDRGRGYDRSRDRGRDRDRDRDRERDRDYERERERDRRR